MLARTSLRAVRPAALRCQVRRYVINEPTPPPPLPEGPKSGTNAFVYLAGAAGIMGGTYYYFNRSSSASAKADAGAAAADKAPTAVKKALTGGDQGFVPLKLDKVEDVNHNTKIFRFKLPEDDMVSGLAMASAILTKYKPEGAEKPIIRPYTPINDEAAQGHLDLLIKQYKGGPMSTHIHSLKPGDSLDIKGPIPKYPWTANMHQHVTLIAGGTGIAPMYQVARAILSNPSDRTKVTLVFGNIAEEDILLKRELAHFENTYPQRFRAFYNLDKPAAGWTGGSGHVTADLLKTVLPGPEDKDAKVFVCGPPGMMKAISGPKASPKDQGELAGILKELGYTSEQVFKF